MSVLTTPGKSLTSLPDHTQLPFKDDEPVRNYQEPLQNPLLSAPLEPVLRELYPEGDYCLGRDLAIYFRMTDPPQLGCKSPDWYLVPNVPATLDGELRRSYVLWQELVAPLIAIEYAADDGTEERDRTPLTGKFWVYERAIRIPFYAIFEWETSRLEVYQLIGGRYQRMTPNERGHYPIEPLGVELGVWHGSVENIDSDWLRWYDANGVLLPTPQEGITKIAEEKQRIADKYERLMERVKTLGIDPENGDTPT